MKTNTQPGAAVSAHTPLPWRAEGLLIKGNAPARYLVCEMIGMPPDPSVAADRELIVRAVNSHEKIVRDLQWIIDRLERGGRAAISDAISQARSALETASVQPTATPGSAASDAAKGGAPAE